jgi:hypothetical protein
VITFVGTAYLYEIDSQSSSGFFALQYQLLGGAVIFGTWAAVVGERQRDETLPKKEALDTSERKDSVLFLQIHQLMTMHLVEQCAPMVQLIETAVIGAGDNPVPPLTVS